MHYLYLVLFSGVPIGYVEALDLNFAYMKAVVKWQLSENEEADLTIESCDLLEATRFHDHESCNDCK